MTDFPITHIIIDKGDGNDCFGYVVNSTSEQPPNWLMNNGYPPDVLDDIINPNVTFAFLNNIYVDDKDRGQGIGNEMISDFMSESLQLEADYVILSCSVDEIQRENFDLQRWYSGHGFIVIDSVSSSNPLMIAEI